MVFINSSPNDHLTVQVLSKARTQGFLTPTQMQALQSLFEQQQAAMQRRAAPAPTGAD